MLHRVIVLTPPSASTQPLAHSQDDLHGRIPTTCGCASSTARPRSTASAPFAGSPLSSSDRRTPPPPTINSTLSGLKFFFDVMLGHAELLVKVQPVHQPRPLPVMLSCDEVARLIASAPNPKYQAALSVAYVVWGSPAGIEQT